MKYFLTSFFLLALFVAPVHAAGSWVQKESGTIQSFQGLTQSGTTIVAVGNGGGIVYSSDGSTWNLSIKTFEGWLNAVEQNGSTVYAVGDSGVLLTSSNQGVTWSSYALDFTARLLDIDFNGGSGYIVGAGGSVLYYNENIKQWLVTNSQSEQDLYGVYGLSDGKQAWAVGNAGELVSTEDGGAHWSRIGSISVEQLQGVYFKDAQNGWVVGTKGTLLKTTNSGSSWSQVAISGLLSQDLHAISANGDVIVVSGKNLLLRSEDAGVTWTAKSFEDTTLNFQDVAVDTDGTTWAAGTKDDVWSKIYKFEVAVEPPPVVIPPVVVPTDFGEASSGDLIKTKCTTGAGVNDPCKAIYFLSEDGKRHAFPNEKVYFTWYLNFNGIVEVSASFMSSRTLGKNVTYHPGTKMVKFQTSPSVYVVEKGGVLRAIGSEQVAAELYGPTWNKQIDDISDAFFGNYTFGAKVSLVSEYNPQSTEASVDNLNANF